jgi:hypothetical protein
MAPVDPLRRHEIVVQPPVDAERTFMTRFKELRRIEAAVEHRDQAQLRWAAEFCRTRILNARTKRAEAHWRRIAKRVHAATDQA